MHDEQPDRERCSSAHPVSAHAASRVTQGLHSHSADSLAPISLSALSRVLVDPHRRKRAVQLAIVTALVEGTPTPASERAVGDLARALDVDEDGLQVLSEIAHGHALMARVDIFRRLTRAMRSAPDFPGFLKFAMPLLGLGGENHELAVSFRGLESCAPGTFGRALYEHFVDNEFKFPGELGGLPLAFHDVGHVLSGYGTDPQGEIQQAAFQAGFWRHDGFTFLLFGILQFHLGLRITPVAQGYRGLFDVSRVLEALRRGAACNVDLSRGFDVFVHEDRSLGAVRASLGIPPVR